MIDAKSLKNIPMGLFLLTTAEDGHDNGCIVSSVQQVSSSPLRISVNVYKKNYSHGLIERTGIFNLNVLTENTRLYIFKKFGNKSGETVDKFDGFWDCKRTENNLKYLTKYANAVYSCKVIGSFDCGETTTFFADVTEASFLNSEPSVTYDFYDRKIKGRPETGVMKEWVCDYCGYIYKGEFLPLNIRCPECGDGFSSFIPLEMEKNPNPRQVCRICGNVHTGELPEDYVCPVCKHGVECYDSI